MKIEWVMCNVFTWYTTTEISLAQNNPSQSEKWLKKSFFAVFPLYKKILEKYNLRCTAFFREKIRIWRWQKFSYSSNDVKLPNKLGMNFFLPFIQNSTRSRTLYLHHSNRNSHFDNSLKFQIKNQDSASIYFQITSKEWRKTSFTVEISKSPASTLLSRIQKGNIFNKNSQLTLQLLELLVLVFAQYLRIKF